MSVTVHHGDCLDVMRGMADNSVDAVVTDPPYGWSFMGRDWDQDVPGPEYWREALRVLKPGGHIVACCGGTTYHRLATAIEAAGFEMRHRLVYMRSMAEKYRDLWEAFAEAQRAGVMAMLDDMAAGGAVSWLYGGRSVKVTEILPGLRSALKVAEEPAVLARKPLSESTLVANHERWGGGPAECGSLWRPPRRPGLLPLDRHPRRVGSDTRPVRPDGQERAAVREAEGARRLRPGHVP